MLSIYLITDALTHHHNQTIAEVKGLSNHTLTDELPLNTSIGSFFKYWSYQVIYSISIHFTWLSICEICNFYGTQIFAYCELVGFLIKHNFERFVGVITDLNQWQTSHKKTRVTNNIENTSGNGTENSKTVLANSEIMRKVVQLNST